MFELIPFDRRNHRVSVYDPFRAFDEMERAFFGSQQPAVLSFRTDVTDTGEAYKLEAELPGFKKEDIKVDLKDGYLTVTAQKNLDKEEHKGKRILRQERYSGSCTRSFYIGDVKAEDVKGKYDAGVLTLEFPKEDQRKLEEKRSISIE